MADRAQTPFDSIESAQEYLASLLVVVAETRADVDGDVALLSEAAEDRRRRDAMRIVAYKLARLESHLTASRRLLSDLRKLRRLLLSEPAHEPWEALAGRGIWGGLER